MSRREFHFCEGKSRKFWAVTLDGATQTLPAIYSLSSADFHDVTAGSNGYRATAGYDLATGRGSPRANLVVRDLVGNATVTAPTGRTSTVTSRTAGGAARTALVGITAMTVDAAAVDLPATPVESPVLDQPTADAPPWRSRQAASDWTARMVRPPAADLTDAEPDIATDTDAELISLGPRP